MTLLLELPADVENQLRADAQRAGVPLETLALERLTTKATPTDRLARVRAARGALVRATGTHGFGVSGFLDEKHADVARENGDAT